MRLIFDGRLELSFFLSDRSTMERIAFTQHLHRHAAAATSPGIIHRGLQCPLGRRVWDCAGHPGDKDQRIQLHDPDRDQDHRSGLFPQQAGLRRGVLSGDREGFWQRAGGEWSWLFRTDRRDGASSRHASTGGTW